MSAAAEGRSPLRRLAIACHGLLIATLAAATLVTDAAGPRAFTAALIVAPLLITLPGLVRGRRTVEQWLAVLLVLYVGGTSVEVVARAGAPLVSAALLAAVAEIGLLLALIRRSGARSPTVRE